MQHYYVRLVSVRIDTSLLLNNYPPHFITQQFNRFLHLNNVIPVLSQLNQHLLYQPKRREKQLQNMMQDIIRTPTVLQTKIWNRQLMFPRYLFNSALLINFEKSFNKWRKQYYALSGSPLERVKVRLVASTNRTLEHFFVHKKPPKEILTKLET